jgi:prolyl-tRNA synthetase
MKKSLEKCSYNGDRMWVFIDNSAAWGGQKFWNNVRKWVPLILKVGSQEIEKNELTLIQRDNIDDATKISKQDLEESVVKILDQIQENIYKKAETFRDENILECADMQSFKKNFWEKSPKFVLVYSDPEVNEQREELLKKLKATARCIPNEFNKNNSEGKCIFTGKATFTKILYAKSY